MTSTLTAIRQAVADTLIAAEIPDLNVFAFLPDQVPTPCAAVIPGPAQFLTYRSSQTSHDLTLSIWVFVQRGTARDASEQLDAYLDDAGPHSIFAAIDAHRTLGGVVDSAIVTDATQWGEVRFGQISYLGVMLTVEILI